MTDWKTWHQQYADQGSSLVHRLAAVQRIITGHLEAAPPGPVRVISACAGDGRDLLGALKDSPRRDDVTGVLVELDADLNALAAEQLVVSGPAGLLALQGDAGLLSTYQSSHGADLLLLCGIFGNISDEDVQGTIEQAARLVAPGATVVWTRHRRAPDLTPAIRQWWTEAGWEETAFVSPGSDDFAVGAARLLSEPLPYTADGTLFTFVR